MRAMRWAARREIQSRLNCEPGGETLQFSYAGSLGGMTRGPVLARAGMGLLDSCGNGRNRSESAHGTLKEAPTCPPVSCF